MDQHNVSFFCDFSEDAEVFSGPDVTEVFRRAEVTEWGEASPDPDSTKESTEE